MYLLHPGMDRTDATICQHLYRPGIKNPLVRKLITVVLPNEKTFKYKYDKSPDKVYEEIPWFKHCLDLIGTYH